MLKQSLGTLLVALLVVVELYEHHPLAGVGVAYHDVAQQTVLLTQVEECHARLESIVAYGIAYAVVQVVHEPALLDRQNFVECASDVESDAVHVVKLCTLGYLLACEPALVAASELKLVAILLDMYRTHDGAELGQWNLADATELVVHLLLLCLELLGIGKVLPLAATTDAEMLAHRLFAYVALLDEAYHFCLAVAMLLLAHLQVDNIARNGKRYEYHHIVDVCQRLALGCHSLDGYVLEYRQRFLFS